MPASRQVEISLPMGGRITLPAIGERIVDMGRIVPILAPGPSLQYLAACCEQRRRGGYDAIVVCDGPRGNGKSTLTLQYLSHVGIGDEAMCMTLDEFSTRSRDLPYADDGPQCAVFDEAGVGLLRQEWWQEFQKDALKWAQVSRIKRSTTWYNLPHHKLLNTALFETLTWCYIWVGIKGQAELHFAVPKKWEGSFFSCEAVLTFDRLDGNGWARYEERKRAYVDSENSTNKKDTWTTRAGKMIEKFNETMTQEDIGKWLGVDQRTVSYALSQHRKHNK